MADNLDRATPRICDYCGEPLGNSVHWIGGEPGVFHGGCLAKRMYLRAPAAEIDRLKALNAELLAALRSGAAYLEAQRCWLKSDANPAARGKPLHLREAASEQVSAELTQIYAAIANAERAGR